MSANKINIAVFISGRGSNMSALIDACTQPNFPAQISLVLSNNPTAKGLELAQQAGLQTAVVDHKNYESREAFESALIETLAPHKLDLICLAGFMRILTAKFIEHYPNRILNIHPSLLPAYKGLNTHARAIADEQSEAGCSVHYVTTELDDGAVILRRPVPILDGDTEDSLAMRVLVEEHIAYPAALKIVATEILT